MTSTPATATPSVQKSVHPKSSFQRLLRKSLGCPCWFRVQGESRRILGDGRGLRTRVFNCRSCELATVLRDAIQTTSHEVPPPRENGNFTTKFGSSVQGNVIRWAGSGSHWPVYAIAHFDVSPVAMVIVRKPLGQFNISSTSGDADARETAPPCNGHAV